MKCHDCESIYSKKESFLDIGVHFGKLTDKEFIFLDSTESGLTYQLSDLINKSHQDEELKDKNSYYCQNCQKHSTLAIKSVKIEKYPPILILTINRFYFDLKTLSRTKILSYVDIPEELTLSIPKDTEMIEEKIYDLYAIIVHRVTGFSKF